MDSIPFEHTIVKAVNTFGLGGLLKASGITDQIAESSLFKTPFTQLTNLTEQPADYLKMPPH